MKLLLAELTARVAENPGFTLKCSEDVVDYLLEKGYDPQYGARPLRRTIQDYLEDFLADQYLSGKIKDGKVTSLDIRDGKIVICDK